MFDHPSPVTGTAAGAGGGGIGAKGTPESEQFTPGNHNNEASSLAATTTTVSAVGCSGRPLFCSTTPLMFSSCLLLPPLSASIACSSF